jgi:hypothetical protein
MKAFQSVDVTPTLAESLINGCARRLRTVRSDRYAQENKEVEKL